MSNKKFILFLAILILLFNVIALYTLNVKVEDCIEATDILIEHMQRKGSK